MCLLYSALGPKCLEYNRHNTAKPTPDTLFELHDEPDRDWLEWAPVLRPASGG